MQDPTNEYVIPVVEELQRKLFTIDKYQGDDQDNNQLDIDIDEDDGMLDHTSFLFILYLKKPK